MSITLMKAYPTSTVAVLSRSEPSRLGSLVARLGHQTVIPNEIIIIWNGTEAPEFAQQSVAPVRVITISPGDFGHGKTRNLALRAANSEILVLLSDDAWPADERWLAELLRPFTQESRVAAVYGRQIVADVTSPDAVFREARYPAVSFPIELAPGRVLDFGRMPISNASSAYHVETLRAAGGFMEDLIVGEDFGAAVTLMDADHAVRYSCESCVIHSHHYGLIAQVRRSFDTATSHRQLCSRLGLRMPRGSGYGSLVRSMGRASARVSWRGRLAVAADVCARGIGVIMARLSPVIPQPLLRRLSAQRWFYTRSGDSLRAS